MSENPGLPIDAVIDKAVELHGCRPDSLVAVMQVVNGELGYLPREALFRISELLEVPRSKAYHVATFYNAFSLTPRGKYVIEVCAGTACHVTGAITLMERLERELRVNCGGTTGDEVFTLEQVRCLGCCSLAPVVRIGGNIHAYLTQDEIPKILRNYRQ
jgi:NADH-quinone oxidoreductase subunit E